MPSNPAPQRVPSIYRFGRASVVVLVAITLLGGVGAWLLLDQREHLPEENNQDSLPIVQRGRPTAREDSYAGSLVCAQCHEEYFESFRQHPMGRSVAQATEIEVSGLNETGVTVSPVGPRSYAVNVKEGVLEHSEAWLDMADGSPMQLYRQTAPVHFAIGSGQRGHSFVTNRDGTLFMSPLTWYAEGNRWDLSPGYQPDNHPRFERQISDGCVACHIGRVNSIENEPDRFQKHAPFAEAAIGCERCHGPAQGHVDRHLNNELDSPDPIINPGKLDDVRRESVCYQCHLHGIKRVPRYGRTEFDFRPGDELSDIWVTFVDGSQVQADGSTTAVSQVEQITQSRCFVESEGRLGCISCHDPHRLPDSSQRVGFYRKRCLNCHSAPGTVCSEPGATRKESVTDNSCIECHMPRLEASDVPHTAQTDHRILKRPQAARKGRQRQQTSGGHAVFLAGGNLPDWEIERAEALMWSRQAEQSADQRLAMQALPKLLKFSRQAPDDIVVLDATIYLTALLGNTREAIRLGEETLKLAPRRESVFESLVLICEASGQPEAGLGYADRQLALNPWRSESHLRRARFLARLRKKKEAIKAAKAALKRNPLLKEARQLLVELLRQSGQVDEAAKEESLLRKLQ